MRAAWLLVFVLLAGCGEPAPTVTAGEPTFSDDGRALPPRPFPAYRWDVRAEREFLTAAGQVVDVPVDVPPGTVSVFVNVTLQAGAAWGFALQMGECKWAREAGFLAGQSFAADCGGIGIGAQTLQLSTGTGALRGVVRVVALVCEPQRGSLPCPAPFPATTS